MVADQPFGGVGEGERELVGEMIPQRPFLGHIGLEIGRLATLKARTLGKRSPA